MRLTRPDLGILTLVSAAAIWFCHWTLDQGEICLHVGTGNLLVAWCVIIYRTLGAEINLLDVYLLPFGLYLLLLGHLISRRQKQKEAQTSGEWGCWCRLRLRCSHAGHTLRAGTLRS